MKSKSAAVHIHTPSRLGNTTDLIAAKSPDVITVNCGEAKRRSNRDPFEMMAAFELYPIERFVTAVG